MFHPPRGHSGLDSDVDSEEDPTSSLPAISVDPSPNNLVAGSGGGGWVGVLMLQLGVCVCVCVCVCVGGGGGGGDGVYQRYQQTVSLFPQQRAIPAGERPIISTED